MNFISEDDKMFRVANMRDTIADRNDAGLDLNFGDDSDSNDNAVIDFGEADGGGAMNSDKDYEKQGILVGNSCFVNDWYSTNTNSSMIKHEEDRRFVEEINIGENHKKEEKRKRMQRIEELKQELVKYQRVITEMNNPSGMTNEEINRKRFIQMHMLQLTEEIDDLNGEEMTIERFWGAMADFDDVAFDYGR